jgi:hypothetical protein
MSQARDNTRHGRVRDSRSECSHRWSVFFFFSTCSCVRLIRHDASHHTCSTSRAERKRQTRRVSRSHRVPPSFEREKKPGRHTRPRLTGHGAASPISAGGCPFTFGLAPLVSCLFSASGLLRRESDKGRSRIGRAEANSRAEAAARPHHPAPSTHKRGCRGGVERWWTRYV